MKSEQLILFVTKRVLMNLIVFRGILILGLLIPFLNAQEALNDYDPSLLGRVSRCVKKEGCKEPLRLYYSKKNPWIQDFNATIRAQYQGAFVDAHEGEIPGSHGATDEWRRFRLGWNAKLFQSFKLVNVWNIGGIDNMGYESNGQWHDHRQAIGNLYDLHIEYAFGNHKISLGKTLPLAMSQARLPSAAYDMPELPTLEEQLRADNTYGFSFSGMDGKKNWGYYAGVWSDTERAYRKAWGTWHSAFITLGVSKNVDCSIFEKGRIHLDWVHNCMDMDKRAIQKFDNRDAYVGTKAKDLLALYYKGIQGSFELQMEALAAYELASYKSKGRIVNPNHVFGLVLTPMYMLTDHIQAVVRYQWSKGNGGVGLARRYSSLVSTNGSYVDEYQSIAIGVNFFVYPGNHQRVKFMTMAEYGNSNRKRSKGGMTGWTYIGGMYVDF